jgi:YaiO family outer membrane protein
VNFKQAFLILLFFGLFSFSLTAQISDIVEDVKDKTEDVVEEIKDFVEDYQVKRKIPKKYDNRLEAYFTYDYLDPDSLYDAWKSETIGYYRTVNKEFNYHLIGTLHQRYDNGFLFEAGLTRVWNRKLFSDAAFSMGSEVDYLQKLRIDFNTYYKFLKHENLIASLGVAWIDYHDVHEDTILRAGLAYYYKRWIVEYVHFRNRSNPGKVDTSTNQVSLGYGREFKHWTYLIYSRGKQGYLATYLDVPQEVNSKSYEITLKHRHWYGKNYGPFLHLIYTNLDQVYEKYNCSLGVFWQF